jgi:hypothetical protein
MLIALPVSNFLMLLYHLYTHLDINFKEPEVVLEELLITMRRYTDNNEAVIDSYEDALNEIRKTTKVKRIVVRTPGNRIAFIFDKSFYGDYTVRYMEVAE